MEGSQSMSNLGYSKRPIVLSPPPLDPGAGVGLQFPPSGSIQAMRAENRRQPSVGYQMQQEFETLTADLDLDLKNGRMETSQIPESKQVPNMGGSIVPPLQTYGIADIGTGGAFKGSLAGDLSSSVGRASGATAGNSSILSSLGTGGSSFLPSLSAVPNRPPSANDFSGIFNFQQAAEPQIKGNLQYQDLVLLSSWIERLSPAECRIMTEYLCTHLSFDALINFKTSLDNALIKTAQQQQQQPQEQSQHHQSQSQTGSQATLQQQHQQQQQHPSQPHNQNQAQQPSQPSTQAQQVPPHHQTSTPYGVLSPYDQVSQSQQDLVSDIDSLSLGSTLSNEHNSIGLQRNTPPLHQPKPKLNPFRNYGHYLLGDQRAPRPKSADESLHNGVRGNNGYQQPFDPLERSKSPTSHLFEKTNFLQLAAANSCSPASHSKQGVPGSEDPMDYAALKLGALATINSRVALDSSKKNHVHGHQPQLQSQTPIRPPYSNSAQNIVLEDSFNRPTNSASVPLALSGSSKPPQGANGKGKKAVDGDKQGAASSSQSPTSNSSMPAEIASPELLNNIPAWLKLLRLHKYTECLKDIPWRDLVELDDTQLEERGVKALGARRKLLKAFAAVKRVIGEPVEETPL
ncbi:Piso0_000196 [Millerozyma farinosa CBS 7064]|uniref:RNA-binding protein VTS1 n=1 Tax=Pichia sorbitophila (strain ATCC MYA-4447 / BCRC 22081 / CBS 7064 / NBRC 10061 / NRRL Y-12695) TaxID=559304 RepID=G8YTC2_PICSO|nr:Piso0_000196 [Millerozyma farinosa CBS 7064]